MVSWLIGLGIALMIFFAVVILFDANRFVIREYAFTSHKLKKDTTFVVLADLHNKSYGRRNHRLLKAIERLHPDAILSAGDILTAKPYNRSMHHAVELMTDLAVQYPVYYANGNHEQRLHLYPDTYGEIGTAYSQALKEAGIRTLINETVYLPAFNITISGSEIDRSYYRHFSKPEMSDKYLNQLLGTSGQDTFQILLAHNPDYFDKYVKWGADLVLSGHVHGGVVRLPFLGGLISPSLHLFPKYDGGLYQKGNTAMVLSRGLGMHTIPVRVFNPGELIVLRLHAEK